MYKHAELPVSRGHVALVVLDMQEYFRTPGATIASNVAAVIEECQIQKAPVFLTQHGHKDIHKDGGALARWWGTKNGDYVPYDTESWKLMPEIFKDRCSSKEFRENRPKEYYLEKDGIFLVDDKTRYDAFEGTHLHQFLQERKIQTIAIAGVMTNLCCETTARSAFVKDYDVIFLTDGCATETKEMHNATLLNMSYGFARLFSCHEFIHLLKNLK